MALRRLSFFFLAALLLAGCNKPDDGGSTVSGGSSSPLPTEATLRLKANKGDKFTMVMEMDTQVEMPSPTGGTPEAHTLKMAVTKEHLCVDVTDGKMKFEEKTIDATGSGTGPFEDQAKKMVEAEKGKTSTRVLDDRNKVVSTSESDPFSLVYPEGPIKVGQTWEAKTKMFDNDVNVTFKVDKFERVGGKTAAVISANFTGSDKLKAIKPLVVFVDTANGWPIKGDGEFEMQPAPGVKAKLIARISVK